MPETGGIGTSIIIITGLGFIALGLDLTKKKNKASFLMLLIICLIPCQALAAEQACIQTYPNKYNEEFVETVDSFTKNVTVENKSSEPAFAKVWAVPEENYAIEYLGWTDNGDDTVSPDAPLMPGESATLEIKITNADGTEIKSDDKELSFDIMVFHELEPIPDPKAYVQITNDEELTAKVSFETPKTTKELQKQLNVKLTLANDDEEKFTLDLIKDSTANFQERLIMEEGLSYEWLLDSLMDKADGTPMHFKNMYPENGIPALGYEFTVSASVKLSYNLRHEQQPVPKRDGKRNDSLRWQRPATAEPGRGHVRHERPRARNTDLRHRRGIAQEQQEGSTARKVQLHAHSEQHGHHIQGRAWERILDK